eukprot:Hpha_TRINITY_DN29938_c0_g1::TRINITY_DN29938_c0_g1_i1::g.131977::m.131977
MVNVRCRAVSPPRPSKANAVGVAVARHPIPADPVWASHKGGGCSLRTPLVPPFVPTLDPSHARMMVAAVNTDPENLQLDPVLWGYMQAAADACEGSRDPQHASLEPPEEIADPQPVNEGFFRAFIAGWCELNPVSVMLTDSWGRSRRVKVPRAFCAPARSCLVGSKGHCTVRMLGEVIACSEPAWEAACVAWEDSQSLSREGMRRVLHAARVACWTDADAASDALTDRTAQATISTAPDEWVPPSGSPPVPATGIIRGSSCGHGAVGASDVWRSSDSEPTIFSPPSGTCPAPYVASVR